MTNTKTTNISATIAQIHRLQEAGCQIIRIAIPNQEAVQAFVDIRKQIDTPLVADIHFDHKLALQSIDAGADKIRINPGNIGHKDRVRQVVQKAAAYKIPIRIGVNSGSLEKDILKEKGSATAEALVASALRNIDLCRQLGSEDLVLSLKSSDAVTTINAYEMVSRLSDVPLHIGVTEAGTIQGGTIKSSVALGILLYQGIGDTLRVSLTSDPVDEVKVAFGILKSLNLVSKGYTFISCPTCGRTEIDLISVTRQVEEKLSTIDKSIKIALMGCEVNGPGEARDADIGVACGKNAAILFRRGKIIRKIAADEIADVLYEEAMNFTESS